MAVERDCQKTTEDDARRAIWMKAKKLNTRLEAEVARLDAEQVVLQRAEARLEAEQLRLEAGGHRDHAQGYGGQDEG